MSRPALRATPVRTAIVPMAGPATRFGPAARAVPLALLPVHDTPLVDLALAEARAAGVERVVLVVAPGSPVVREHVAGLAAREGAPEVVFAEQPMPMGVGDAVLRASAHALPGPVAVILPDDVVLGVPALPEMVERYQRCSAGYMVGVGEVPISRVSRHGVIDPMDPADRGGVIRAVGLVWKPTPEEAPSRLAVAGRYILHPGVFVALAKRRAKDQGPFGLDRKIDAAIDTAGLAASLLSGDWHDCSTPDGLLEAGIAHRRLTKSSRLQIAAE